MGFWNRLKAERALKDVNARDLAIAVLGRDFPDLVVSPQARAFWGSNAAAALRREVEAGHAMSWVVALRSVAAETQKQLTISAAMRTLIDSESSEGTPYAELARRMRSDWLLRLDWICAADKCIRWRREIRREVSDAAPSPEEWAWGLRAVMLKDVYFGVYRDGARDRPETSQASAAMELLSEEMQDADASDTDNVAKWMEDERLRVSWVHKAKRVLGQEAWYPHGVADVGEWLGALYGVYRQRVRDGEDPP